MALNKYIRAESKKGIQKNLKKMESRDFLKKKCEITILHEENGIMYCHLTKTNFDAAIELISNVFWENEPLTQICKGMGETKEHY